MWKDSETNIDYLNLGHIINVLNEMILDDNLTPATIGVYGAWGSGKSSVLMMSEKILSKKENVLCIKFNSWLFEDYFDIRSALLGTILQDLSAKLPAKDGLKEKAKGLMKSLNILGLLKKTVGYGLDIAFNGASNIISSLVNENIDKESENISEISLRANIKQFASTFKEIIEKAELKRVVVYIDELDRCNPEKIIEILEAIRLFAFVQGISFVIGADERLIQYAIERKYENLPGNSVSIGKEYLDKLIQYVIYIPILTIEEMFNYICLLHIEDSSLSNKEEIINEILSKMKDDIFYKFSADSLSSSTAKDEMLISKMIEIENVSKSLSIIFDLGFQGNPRKCKRFLNNLYMRMKIAEIRNLKLNVACLCKLMMLEYYKPEAYKILLTDQSENKGLARKLYSESDSDDPYILYRKDQWFIQWFNNQPSLKDLNLDHYIYVSRSNYKLSLTHLSLSPFAEKIFNDLVSGSQIFEEKALNESPKLAEDEAIMLFEKLKDFSLATEKPSNVIKPLLKLSIQHPILKDKTIDFLNNSVKDCGVLKFAVGEFKDYYRITTELQLFDEKVNKDDVLKKIIKNNKKG